MRHFARLAALLAVALTLIAWFGRPPDTLAEPEAAGAACPADRDAVALPAGAIARVGSTSLRIDSWPLHLEYSPDGTLLASLGSEFRILQVWDTRTGALVRRVEFPIKDELDETPYRGRFAADSKTMLLFNGRTARWVDVRSGKETRQIDVNLSGLDVAISPGGDMAAALDENKSFDLVVLDLPSGKERFRKARGALGINALTFAPDGQTLAVLDQPPPKAATVRLLETKTGKEVGTINPADPDDRFVTFAPDSKKLLLWHPTKANHHAIAKWHLHSVPSGKLLRTVEMPAGVVSAAAFTPGGQLLFACPGAREAYAARVDPDTGKELGRLRLGIDRSYVGTTHLTFTPDGTGLAFVHGGYISQWDLSTGRRRAASSQVGNYPRQFSSDGKLLWVEREGALALVDWRSGREARRVPGDGQSVFLSISPDGSRIAGTNAAGKLTVWDAGSGRGVCGFDVSVPLARLPYFCGITADPAGDESWWLAPPIFSADSRMLYVVEAGKRVRVLDAVAGKELPAYESAFAAPTLVGPRIASDGRQLAGRTAVKSGDTPAEVLVCEPAKRREVRRLAMPADITESDPLAFSPGGDLLALRTMEQGISVRDVRTDNERFSNAQEDHWPMDGAFSPDGRLLAIADSYGEVHVWEVATGRERQRFAVRLESPIECVVFSPDGKFLATGNHQDACLVWDVEGRYGQPPAATPFTAAEADKLWADLNDLDAEGAFRAMRQMLARPGPGVSLLRDRLPPAPALGRQTVRRLLDDLDADAFAVRERATVALEAIADRAAPQLREALANRPSAELRRRLEPLLATAEDGERRRRRELRAVEVAERLGTAAARDLLRTWAGGDAAAVQTQAARAAIERLKGRKD